MPRVPGCDAVYEVADQWRDRCLIGDGSLLWPDLDEPTWTIDNLRSARDTINELVVKNTNTDGHMEQQFREEPEEIKRVVADATAIWNLCPGSIRIDGRKQFVKFVAGWVDSPPLLDDVNTAIQANIGGKESAWFKPGFQLQRGAHLRFIFEFGRRLKIEKVDPSSYLDIRNLAQNIHQEYPRSASAKNMVLHLLFPDETEPIFNNWARDRIAEAPEFARFIAEASDFDDALAAIRHAYETKPDFVNFDFYDPEFRGIWRSPGNQSVSDRVVAVSGNGDGSPALSGIHERDSAVRSLTDLVGKSSISLDKLDGIERLIRDKKQIILEGPPGSGKTYVARLFARYLAGLPLEGVPDEHVEIVQFHQSYGYEDFVAGIRPLTNPDNGQLTYETRPGIFVEMCQRALAKPTDTFVLIIDEINRGNLSRIFGELLYGLEYRDQPVRMQYPVTIAGVEQHHLTIPKNLYLIGTMNSTDRSLAMIDYALRRRFYFWRLMPVEGNDAPVLRRWLASQPDVDPADRAQLLQAFIALNTAISQELGPDYQIGHSYFMLDDGELGNLDAQGRVWAYAVEPLLREYFHTRRDVDSQLARFRNLFFGSPATILDDLDMDEPAL